MSYPKAIKCEFCGKRYVKQQEWKKDFEKRYCSTCICFIKYCIGLEKALREQAEFLGIYKNIFIEIRNLKPEEKLMSKIGLQDNKLNLLKK